MRIFQKVSFLMIILLVKANQTFPVHGNVCLDLLVVLMAG